MEQINLDSDCEIQDVDLSTISIPDSVVDISECNVSDGEIEDGEVESNGNNDIEDSVQIIEDTRDDPTSNSMTATEHKELFVVSFPHKEVFQKLGHTIMNTLQSALEQEANECITFSITENSENWICLKAFTTETTCAADTVDADSSEIVQIASPETEETTQEITEKTTQESIQETAQCLSSDQVHVDKEDSPDLSDLSSLFMVDTVPAKKLDTIKVPCYKRTIKDVLNEESAQKRKKNTQDECTRVRPSTSCFNCGSMDHSIRECQKPRNLKRIMKAKKAFGNKSERYHVDIEQRFAHLRPGVISDKLQSALGLRRGELPFFFYRMRVLGYPPGWLEDAKVAHSGITLFNSEGNAVLKPDECEGEIDALNHKYDVSKIVGFPGFNVNPGKSFYDDYKHHNVPPINELDLKETFIKTLGDNIINGYKRKKLVDLPAVGSPTTTQISSLEVADMEIEDAATAEPNDSNVVFSRPMPPSEPCPDEVPPPPPETPPETPTSDEIGSGLNDANSRERSQSPTLEDLEAQQLRLLQELQSNISNVTEDSLIDEVLELEGTQEEETTAEEMNSNAVSPPADNKEEVSPTKPPLTSVLDESAKKADIIKESHMGTPLLKFSPFDKLPAGENFKVGVSDVINFENLPDSTGKYEQMKVVIKKVRNIITKLNSEDD